MSGDDERFQRELARRNWLILAILFVLSLFWRSFPVTLGVLGGGLLVIFNYRSMGRSISQLLNQPESGSQRAFKVNYMFRLAFIAFALFLLIAKVKVHPIALAVGLSVVVLNMFVATIKRLY